MPTHPLAKMIKDIELTLALVKAQVNSLIDENENLEKENKELKDKREK